MKTPFSILIGTGKEKCMFSFMQVYYGSHLYYNVTTKLENKPLVFRMKNSGDDKWKIIPQTIPEWIFDLESQLASAIKES
jgi:hypothetical protein